MNKDEKAGLWSERIREFRFSGQTCRDWCTEHQIPVSTMTYWIRKLKQEKISSEVDKEPVFAKLPSESEIVMRDTAQRNPQRSASLFRDTSGSRRLRPVLRNYSR